MKTQKTKKALSLGLAMLLTTGLLTGCGSKNTGGAKSTGGFASVALEETAKEFDAYTHVIVKRYDYKAFEGITLKQGQIEVPEGYEILEIENYTEKYGAGSRTGGFIIWFINNKKVKATSSYNDKLEVYDYSNPGVVVEEIVKEENPTLQLTQEK